MQWDSFDVPANSTTIVQNKSSGIAIALTVQSSQPTQEQTESEDYYILAYGQDRTLFSGSNDVTVWFATLRDETSLLYTEI